MSAGTQAGGRRALRKACIPVDRLVAGATHCRLVFSGRRLRGRHLLLAYAGGAVAGSAGIIELLGYHGRFLWLYSPGYGWDGIIIATLARNNPLFVPLAALFLSYIRVGAKIMGRYTNIAPEIVAILQAVIILLVTAEAFLAKWKQRSINKEATQNEASETPVQVGEAR